jgi:protein-disulfide isomerase
MTSAHVPPVGPDDHVSGSGPEAVVYMDLACPRCAGSWARMRTLELSLCFRHFPMAAKHPRSPALHAAVEAAGAQGRFWEMCDSLYAERGRVDDPHLWERAQRFGIDLERFRAEARSDAVAQRVRRDFESGVRAGVAGTPTAFEGGRRIDGEVEAELARIAAG